MLNFAPYKDGYSVAVQFLQDAKSLYYSSAPRPWLDRELGRYSRSDILGFYTPYHPGVIRALETLGRPHNWHQILMEVPHLPTSTTDPTKVAYTRDDKHGEADRQTVTTLGKYITRHWPHAPSHLIRDLTAVAAAPKLQIWTTATSIIWALETGPRSCMKAEYGSIPFDTDRRDRLLDWVADHPNEEADEDELHLTLHPYITYAPKYGWAMATLPDPSENGKQRARALVWTNPKNPSDKGYVRTYQRAASGDEYWSESSHGLEALLKDAGYRKWSSWPQGAKLRHIDHPRDNGPLVPYIDGDERHVVDHGEYLEITHCPENHDEHCWLCDNTDGTGSPAEGRYTWTCDRCGDRMTDEDDTNTVGRERDMTVCDSCLDNHYTEVRGMFSRWIGSNDRFDRYSEYYVRGTYAEQVVGQDYYIDEDNPPEDVVQLESGAWAELDDTVRIGDEYYMVGDIDVVQTVEEDPYEGHNYGLKEDCWQDADDNWHQPHVEYITYEGANYVKDDCWQCEGDGVWYPDTEEATIDPDTGDTVHPDWLAPINRDCMDEGGEAMRQHDLYAHTETPVPPNYLAYSDERFALAA